jgi:phosphoribosylaminoimidazole-succinocarboxamide synthase
MARRRQLYEGKAKILFEGPEPGTLVQYFKDDATAFNAQKKGTITGKGVLNNRISEYLMTRLNEMGVPTHFIRRLNMREQLIKEVEIIPLEVVVRNVVAGSLAKRFGMEEGSAMPRSIVEYYYKSDELGDPMVSEEHITAFGWASYQDIDEVLNLSLRINDFLTGLFAGVGVTSAGSRRATRKSRGGSGSCRKPARATSRGRRQSSSGVGDEGAGPRSPQGRRTRPPGRCDRPGARSAGLCRRR